MKKLGTALLALLLAGMLWAVAADASLRKCQSNPQSVKDHRAASGAYARTLAELSFFASRPPVPIELVTSETSWSASVLMEGLATVCTITPEARAANGAWEARCGAAPE